MHGACVLQAAQPAAAWSSAPGNLLLYARPSVALMSLKFPGSRRKSVSSLPIFLPTPKSTPLLNLRRSPKTGTTGCEGRLASTQGEASCSSPSSKNNSRGTSPEKTLSDISHLFPRGRVDRVLIYSAVLRRILAVFSKQVRN